MIFNKGHRLRVLITSSNVPGYDPNPNTGDRFRANARTRPAQITIFADSRRASFIELPIPKEQ
jgi:predicted acyl esterase